MCLAVNLYSDPQPVVRKTEKDEKIVHSLTFLCRPWWFYGAEAPTFQNSRHIKVVNLSAPCNGRLYPIRGISMVFISVKGYDDPRTMVRPEGLYQ